MARRSQGAVLRGLCVELLKCNDNDARANPDPRLPYDAFWSERLADVATRATVVALARAFLASPSRRGGRGISDVLLHVVARGELRADDARAPGRYRVWFASPLPPGKAAAAALDVFHSSVALRDPDAVRIRITSGRDGRVLSADPRHRPYSFRGEAALERIEPPTPSTHTRNA